MELGCGTIGLRGNPCVARPVALRRRFLRASPRITVDLKDDLEGYCK